MSSQRLGGKSLLLVVFVINLLLMTTSDSLAHSDNPSSSTEVSRTLSAGAVPRALNVIWFPKAVMQFHLPHATVSRYMQTTDWAVLRDRGCKDGESVPERQDVVIVLDFGQPWFSNNEYGTIIYGSYDFRSITQIEEGAKGYISGFFECMGQDVHLTLAIGTSNYGQGVTEGHGGAWAEMINELNLWIESPPSYESNVTARGANDIEPGFNGSLVTRSWIEGYNAASLSPSYYYNFGSCDGCPYSSCPTCDPVGDWTIEDVWYVSYGARTAFPLPEIYLRSGANADQWQRMSLYGYTHHGQAMAIRGSFTQWHACQTTNCDGTDNRPEQGWIQLSTALNSDPRTAQPLNWATDISWER